MRDRDHINRKDGNGASVRESDGANGGTGGMTGTPRTAGAITGRWHKLGHGISLLIIGCVLIGVGLSLGGHWNAIPWWPWTNGDNAMEA